jgi:hypothetical protein
MPNNFKKYSLKQEQFKDFQALLYKLKNFCFQIQELSRIFKFCTNLRIEMNRTGTQPPTGHLKPNWKASPSLFTHGKSVQSVNHDINTRVCMEVRFGFKKKIGSLSEGSVPVIYEPA